MSRPERFVESAAIVSGYPAAYLARVLRRHLRRDLQRDGLPAELAVEVEAVVRAIYQAAATYQREQDSVTRVTGETSRSGGVHVTAEPVDLHSVSSSLSMLTTDEAAAVLGIGEPAVRKRIRAGQLSGRKDGDGRWLVDADVVHAAAERGAG